jgi:hypothetical protein
MLSRTEINRIKTRITNIFRKYTSISPGRVSALLPIKSLQGKLYEADVLATICRNLSTIEKLSIKFVGRGKLILRQKGGKIDRSYPYFEILNKGKLIGELFTDIYFNTLSHNLKSPSTKIIHGDFHELDIALLKPNQNGFADFNKIMLAVECKNTSIKKSIIREILGFRRELSFFSKVSVPSNFNAWPSNIIHANPNSIHMFYCSDSRVLRYDSNCYQFGIILVHHRM